MTPEPESKLEGTGRREPLHIRPVRLLGIPWGIWWILLLALALRGLARWRFDPVTFDSAVYFEMADLLRTGRWSEALAYPYPPLFPILVAAVQWPGWSAETAGLIIALTANIAVLFPLTAISRITFGETAALATGFLWAIHPLAIRLGAQALTDAPTAFFVALALWAGIRALEAGRLAWILGAGAASGFAYLLRPEGIEPVLALAVLSCRYVGSPARASAKTSIHSSGCHPGARIVTGRPLYRVGWVVAPLVGWAVIASPYVVFLSAEAGALTLSKKKSGLSFLQSISTEITGPSAGVRPPPLAPARRAGRDEAGQGQNGAWDVAKGSSSQGSAPVQPQMGATPSQVPPAGQTPFGFWVRRMTRGAYVFQKPLVNGMHPLLLMFALVAAWGCHSGGTEGSRRARALLLGLLALHLAVLLGLAIHLGPDYLGGHHFFLMVLYALPFAGAGLAWTVTRAMGRLGAQRWLLAVGLAGLVALPVGWLATRGVDRGIAVRPAAAWIRSQVVGTPVIVTNIAKLTYHAGAERVELMGTYDQILKRSRERSAHFLVFYTDLLPNVSHDFLTRLEASDQELVQTFHEPSRGSPDQRLEIYRLRPGRQNASQPSGR